MFRHTSVAGKEFAEPLQQSRCTVCDTITFVTGLCDVHADGMYGIEIRPSTVCDGLGLFATRDLVTSTDVTPEFTGERLTNAELNERYGSDPKDLAPYAIAVDADEFIDAACQRCWPAYINHAARGSKACNARFVVHRGRVRVVATKRIPAGTEILADYGPDYWRRRNKKP
jgi:hypothetical protein